MTITTMKAMSASAAFLEIWLPQLAPIEVRLIWFCGTPNRWLSALSTLSCWLTVSGRVCTCHLAAPPPSGVIFWTMPAAPPPGPAARRAPRRHSEAPRRELVARAALEIHAEVQPEHEDGDDADGQDCARDRVPEPLAGNELDRDLATVELAADTAERRHHASFAVAGLADPVAGLPEAVAGLADRTGGRVPRPGALPPSGAGSRRDRGWPPPKNLVRASSVIIGLVKVNTTTRSMIVVRPRVNAKPFTSPMAK